MRFYRILITLAFTFLLYINVVFAQENQAFLKVEGLVHGYEFDNSRGFLKKSKPIVLEGVLEKVTIKLYDEEELVDSLYTNEQGFFNLHLKFNKLYTIVLNKNGYNKNTILFDTRAYPEDIQKYGFELKAMEFVLNSFNKGEDKSLDRNLGRLYFHPGKNELSLILTENKEDTGLGLFQSKRPDTPLEMIQRAIKRNNERLLEYHPPLLDIKATTRSARNPSSGNNTYRTPSGKSSNKKKGNGSNDINGEFPLNPFINYDNIPINELEAYVKNLEKIKEKHALDILIKQTRNDSILIKDREKQIELVEQQIKNAKLIISYQEEKLNAQRYSLYMLVSMILMLSGFSFLIFTYYKQKKQTTVLLESKNRQITDSISYARRIQQSILLQENELQKHLPEAFVFLEPKDIVSGDFYFFAKVDGKYIIAAADCTGHGVPGAFMSLIGHRLLREIVIEKKEFNPAKILEKLHIGILEALRQEEGPSHSQDGMDISICQISPEEKTIVFAGAMNPAYLVHGNDLQVLQADINSVGGKSIRPGKSQDKRCFTNKAICFNEGDMLYLFTDGFMDQFGGESDQKFNTKRFKDMLIKISKEDTYRQKSQAFRTLAAWKSTTPQTDDILLIGVRL